MARSRKKSSAQEPSTAKAAAAKATEESTPEDAEGTTAQDDAVQDDAVQDDAVQDDAVQDDVVQDATPIDGTGDRPSGKDPVATTPRASGKDPVAPPARGAKSARKKGSTASARGTSTTVGGEVTEKAKDSTRSASVKKTAAAETSRNTGRRVAAAGQNPAWLAPTAVVFLILGLLYLVTYYLSSGQLPLPIDDWNLAVGFGVLMVGGGMLMFWK